MAIAEKQAALVEAWSAYAGPETVQRYLDFLQSSKREDQEKRTSMSPEELAAREWEEIRKDIRCLKQSLAYMHS